MTIGRLALAALLLAWVLSSTPLGAQQPPPPGPWDPAVQAAAEKAAARLGANPGLAIRATILTVPGLQK